jgi:hypothetical protein
MKLYEQDFYKWTQETSQLIKKGKFDQVDWENVIEEIEALGRSEKRAIRSYLIVVIKHLLKWQYQPEHQSGSWRASIHNSRNHLLELLEENPSLRGDFVAEAIVKVYKTAREEASEETTIFLDKFPLDCPYSVEQLLDSDFLS